MSIAHIVVDLGFGDSGKGTITDFLCREEQSPWVVRFNGGAQAGHNVITDEGLHHTFAQFGAASFQPDVQTYLGPEFLLHPGAMLVEAERFETAGGPPLLPRLSISEHARLITPMHQALGRLREWSRGDSAHGTCGVGIGETVRDSLLHPQDALRIRDLLRDDASLLADLKRVQERLRSSLHELTADVPQREAVDAERSLLLDGRWFETWLRQIAPLRDALRRDVVRVDDGEVAARICQEAPAIVMEGAQGVLLDEDYGFHPHTTWSRCTDAYAQSWLDEHGFQGERNRLGVIRTYLTRHGHGPLPSHAPHLDAELPEPHNAGEGWQGAFRRGWPDPLLWRYAIEANGGIDGLAITHLDRAVSIERHVCGYAEVPPSLMSDSQDFAVAPRANLSYQATLTDALSSAKVRTTPFEKDFLSWARDALQVKVKLASEGPRPSDKRWL